MGKKKSSTSTRVGSLARRCASLPSVSIMTAMLNLQANASAMQLVGPRCYHTTHDHLINETERLYLLA
jgi:hypothetical protein